MASAAVLSRHHHHRILPLFQPSHSTFLSIHKRLSYGYRPLKYNLHITQSLSSSSSSSTPTTPFNSPIKLFVSGLSFRTTEETLGNAFKNYGELLQVNLVMDKIAKRPRGFAFITYATDEESKRAIQGMHGKFLDGRVIFVEVAKPKVDLRQGLRENP